MAADPIKDKPVENIFRITDEIVHQLNKTKKMVILMIISIVVVLPVTHIITFALIGETVFDERSGTGGRPGPPWLSDRSGGSVAGGGGPPDNAAFRIVQAVVIGTILFWLGIGIRQWFVLSKWTKKYKQYKELQKKIDEKLDYDNDNNEGNEGQRQ